MGTTRSAVTVASFAAVAETLDALGLRRGRPVVVLVGGADGMGEADRALADRMLRDAVFPLLDRLDAVVVDGGTDGGVMQVAGRARDAVGARFPLVGVVVAEAMRVDDVPLEPHHTHTLLVPGSAWGEESPWLAGVASAVAGGQPSATLVVNGGSITYDDIAHSLAADRPIVVIAGTGRTADAIAAASAGATSNARATSVAASPLTTVVALADTAAIRAALEDALCR